MRLKTLRKIRRRMMVAAALIIAGPPLVDAANGWVKSDGGCAVNYVVDGDTLSISCPDGYMKLRLQGIDTPEKKGACWGEVWRAFLATQQLRWALLSARQIDLPDTGPTDRYGRRLGQVLVDGVSVSDRLLTLGLAVPYVPGDIGWCERIERGLI